MTNALPTDQPKVFVKVGETAFYRDQPVRVLEAQEHYGIIRFLTDGAEMSLTRSLAKQRLHKDTN